MSSCKQPQEIIVIVCQVGHFAGQYLQVVCLASAVKHLPVSHDDLAEQPSAKCVDECLLVPGIEDRFPVLYQCAEGQQYHVYHQYAADGYLHPSILCQTAYGKSDALGFSPAADTQQLQQRDEQHYGEAGGHSLHHGQQKYQQQFIRLVRPEKPETL